MNILRKIFSLEGFGVTSPFDPAFNFVTSPVFSPLVLGALRLLVAVYTLTVAITTLAYEAVVFHDADSYFSYFTDLSYIGLVAYFWAASVQTIAFVLRGRKSYPLQTWPRILQLLHVLLHSTITVFPIVVTVVFWTLLSSSATFQTTYDTWSNISRHAINTGLAFFEILLTNSGPSPWSHLIVLVIILACYLGVAYITRATQGFYVYSFLDPSQEHTLLAAYIMGILLGSCVVFIVIKGISILRRRINMRYGRLEDYSTTEAIDEWQDVEAHKESSAVEA